MKRDQSIILAAIIVGAVVAIALILAGIVFFPLFAEMKNGYTKMEGFLELRSYPKVSEIVPTVMVYVLVPTHDKYEIYLTEDGKPLSSLEKFSENNLVRIEGVSYSRDAFDRSETYWMIEMFNISKSD